MQHPQGQYWRSPISGRYLNTDAVSTDNRAWYWFAWWVPVFVYWDVLWWRNVLSNYVISFRPWCAGDKAHNHGLILPLDEDDNTRTKFVWLNHAHSSFFVLDSSCRVLDHVKCLVLNTRAIYKESWRVMGLNTYGIRHLETYLTLLLLLLFIRLHRLLN